MELQHKQLTHTKVLHNHARNKVDNSKLPQSHRKVDVQEFKMLFQADRLLLQLMLEDGHIMPLEFLITVVRT